MFGLTGIAFFLFALLPVLLFRSGGAFEGKLIIQIIGLCATIIFPFWNYFLRYNHGKIERIIGVMIFSKNYLNSSNSLLHKKSFYISVLIIGFLQLGYLFYDPIINQPKIINEYFNLPEETILKDGQRIENTAYFKVVKPFQSDNILDVDTFTANHLPYSTEQEWLASNTFEIHWQIMSRFMIHHNSFIFIPLSDFSLDKNISSINAQYGIGSTWAFEKLLSKVNNLSLDGWLKLSYLFYYIYFALFITVTLAITRNLAWTSMIFLLSLTVINHRGYDFLLLPPGESPWRHIFDIIILYCLFLYVEKKNFIYYLLALLFGVFSIVINPQIGTMIFTATIVSGIFYVFREKFHIKRVIITTVAAIIMVGMCFIYFSSANDVAQYYIDGVLGFPISVKQMFKIFVMILIGYLLLWKIIKDRLSLNYMYLVFLVIYSQELILYVVWHYNGDGFKSRAFIYILTVALLLFPFRSLILERWKNYVIIAITVVVAIVYIGSVSRVQLNKRQYEKIFEHHKTYEWNMDRAHIISTMNPVYFQDGVDLIQKYSKGQNGIYIVSEYDNFLPFLAHKYSLMPFFDLKWYLITPKELDKSIKTLENKKPEYLFVDTGIDRDLSNEIIDSKLPKIGYLHEESVWRAQRLKLLNVVFQGVASEYQLIEKGHLISVYKRKGFNETH